VNPTKYIIKVIEDKVKEEYRLSNVEILEVIEAISYLAKDSLSHISLKKLYPIFFEDNKKLSSILTKRELEILSLISIQKNSTAISIVLDITLSTVETHRKNIRRKLNIKNNGELYRYAMIANIIIEIPE